eukprot:Partr_v1_DN27623_c1_g1_i1_m64892 putative serine threonine kinase 16
MSLFRRLQNWIYSWLFPSGSRSVTLNSDHRYRIIKRIGEGGFAYVYLVERENLSHGGDPEQGLSTNSQNNRFALKKLRIEMDEQIQGFEHEVAAHLLANASGSAHIVKLLESKLIATGTSTYGYLLFPFYPDGSAQDLLDLTAKHHIVLTIDQILKIVKGICKGLEVFHSLEPDRMAFRDLKPANVLLDSNGFGVLADLGSVDIARVSVRDRTEALRLQDKCAVTVTAPFRPPELFDITSMSVIDERTDIWSLGCTLYALAYRESPFNGTLTSSMSGRVVFPDVPQYPQRYQDVIKSCLKVEMNERPYLEDIVG